MNDEVSTPATTTRSVRAATRRLAVCEVAPDLYLVDNGKQGKDHAQYRVDPTLPACECRDWQHRSDTLGDDGCLHIRRVRMERGEIDITPLLGTDLSLDPLLLEALADVDDDSGGTSSDARMAVADGGLPEHLTKLSTIDGGAVVHCQTCGAEGEAVETVDHHDDCPDTESSDSAIIQDGEYQGRYPLSDVDVQIVLDEDTHEQLREEYEQHAAQGGDESFETFVYNRCETDMQVTVDGDGSAQPQSAEGDEVDYRQHDESDAPDSIPAPFDQMPTIDDPDDHYRQRGALLYPPEAIPDDGPIPDIHHTHTVEHDITVPDWALEAAKWRLSHADQDDVGRQRVREYLTEYASITERFVTTGGRDAVAKVLKEADQ